MKTGSPSLSSAICPLFEFENSSISFLEPVSQRADVNCVVSKWTGIPYSISILLAKTSNCKAPTTPTIKPDPIIGLNNFAAPSSANCINAFSKFLPFIGSVDLTDFNNSGANDGMPINLIFSPSVKASPILNCP